MDAYPQTKFSKAIQAKQTGFMQSIDTMALGFAGIQLGAGRRVISDKIDFSSGMYIHKKLGDKVEIGEEVLTLYSNDETALGEVVEQLSGAFEYSGSSPEIPPLIVERIS